MSSSASDHAREIPTDEPSRAGLTKAGGARVTGAPSRTATYSTWGMPCAVIRSLKTDLSMATAEPSTPAPT